MTIFQDILKENLNKEIVVETIDGHTFKGKLIEFDHEALQLTDVLERKNARTHDWCEYIVSIPLSLNPAEKKGLSGVSLGKLTSVVIRLNTISRIWNWEPVMSTQLTDMRFL